MKIITIVKYILVFITAIIGFLFFIWLFYFEEIGIGELFSGLFAIGVFELFLFNFDKVASFIVESKLAKVVVDLKDELETVRKELPEAMPALEIYAKEVISVTDKAPRVDVVVTPEVQKLKATLDRVEVITDKAEKLLSGKIAGKSDVSGDLTVDKKQ